MCATASLRREVFMKNGNESIDGLAKELQQLSVGQFIKQPENEVASSSSTQSDRINGIPSNENNGTTTFQRQDSTSDILGSDSSSTTYHELSTNTNSNTNISTVPANQNAKIELDLADNSNGLTTDNSDVPLEQYSRNASENTEESATGEGVDVDSSKIYRKRGPINGRATAHGSCNTGLIVSSDLVLIDECGYALVPTFADTLAVDLLSSGNNYPYPYQFSVNTAAAAAANKRQDKEDIMHPVKFSKNFPQHCSSDAEQTSCLSPPTKLLPCSPPSEQEIQNIFDEYITSCSGDLNTLLLGDRVLDVRTNQLSSDYHLISGTNNSNNYRFDDNFYAAGGSPYLHPPSQSMSGNPHLPYTTIGGDGQQLMSDSSHMFLTHNQGSNSSSINVQHNQLGSPVNQPQYGRDFIQTNSLNSNQPRQGITDLTFVQNGNMLPNHNNVLTQQQPVQPNLFSGTTNRNIDLPMAPPRQFDTSHVNLSVPPHFDFMQNTAAPPMTTLNPAFQPLVMANNPPGPQYQQPLLVSLPADSLSTLIGLQQQQQQQQLTLSPQCKIPLPVFNLTSPSPPDHVTAGRGSGTKMTPGVASVNAAHLPVDAAVLSPSDSGYAGSLAAASSPSRRTASPSVHVSPRQHQVQTATETGALIPNFDVLLAPKQTSEVARRGRPRSCYDFNVEQMERLRVFREFKNDEDKKKTTTGGSPSSVTPAAVTSSKPRPILPKPAPAQTTAGTVIVTSEQHPPTPTAARSSSADTRRSVTASTVTVAADDSHKLISDSFLSDIDDLLGEFTDNNSFVPVTSVPAQAPSNQGQHLVSLPTSSSSQLREQQQMKQCRITVYKMTDSQMLYRDAEGNNNLHIVICCQANSVYMLQCLLERAHRQGTLGQLISERNNRGRTPLLEAVYHRQVPMVRLLLTFGADPNVKAMGPLGPSGEQTIVSPLLVAAERGVPYLQTLYTLLEAPSINLDIRNHKDMTAVHVAVDAHGRLVQRQVINSAPTIQRMLARGASLAAKDGCSKTPLHYAVEKRDIALLRFLLNQLPTDSNMRLEVINAKMVDYQTCLHIAARLPDTHVSLDDHRAIVCLLLQHGADTEATLGGASNSRPHECVSKGRPEIAALIHASRCNKRTT